MKQFTEFIFILLGLTLVFLLFPGCLGCGKNCIETPDCGTVTGTDNDTDMVYASLPMCGGCLTYEWGCSSCLYPQKCLISCGDYDDGSESGIWVFNCDNIYYGNSCGTCGTTEAKEYAGYAASGDGCGCYTGSTNGNERFYGCVGCSCADGKENMGFADVGDFVEDAIDYGKLLDYAD